MIKLEYRDEIIELKPSKILAAAKNYKKHIEEMDSSVPDEPKFFLKPPSSLIGNNGTVIIPEVSSRVDYEVELGVIIRDRCKNISPFDFGKHILGYTVFVDVTARDIQIREKEKGMPWSVAKGFDTFAPIGPVVVPPEEVNPENLDIWLKLNGKFKQKSNTGNMIFNVFMLGAFMSRIMTLEPMDIIATGTPEGVGPMSDGDFVEAGIEGIGILKFTVKGEVKRQ